MPVGTPTERDARHVALAAAAKAGDRSALDELASEVWGITYAKASKYARVFGADRDDLAQVALMRLSMVLKSFNPEAGTTFLGYYCYCACRIMVEVGQRSWARSNTERSYQPDEGEETPIDLQAARSEKLIDARTAWAALDLLSPIQRHVLLEVVGLGKGEQRRRPTEKVAADLGVSELRLLDIYDDAVRTVRRAVEQAAA